MHKVKNINNNAYKDVTNVNFVNDLIICFLSTLFNVYNIILHT